MYIQSTAHMTAEEVLAQHELDRQEEEKRQDIRAQLDQLLREREARSKAEAEAERQRRIVNAPPPDPIDVAAAGLVNVLGEKYEPLIDALIGIGGNAEPAVRRLLVLAKQARMAQRQAEVRADEMRRAIPVR